MPASRSARFPSQGHSTRCGPGDSADARSRPARAAHRAGGLSTTLAKGNRLAASQPVRWEHLRLRAGLAAGYHGMPDIDIDRPGRGRRRDDGVLDLVLALRIARRPGPLDVAPLA